jgi:uncharacterized protein (DUF1499 family)
VGVDILPASAYNLQGSAYSDMKCSELSADRQAFSATNSGEIDMSGWSGIMIVTAGLLSLLWSAVFVPTFASAQKESPGECPSSPNCVSSRSADPQHAIDPLHYDMPADQAFECLKRILGGMKRSRIVSEGEEMLRVEFRTLLGFVDDAEFQLDRSNGVIHMRSAARVGYWDLGVNRRRLEEIRTRFSEFCVR